MLNNPNDYHFPHHSYLFGDQDNSFRFLLSISFLIWSTISLIFSWVIERPLNFAQQPTFYIAVISDYLQTSIFYSTPSCFFSHFSLIFPSPFHHKFYIRDKASQKGPRTVQSMLPLVTLCSFSLFVLLLRDLMSPLL